MKRRLVMALFVLASVALMAGSATYALFSANTGNINNQYQAGRVILSADRFPNVIPIGPMAPGDEGEISQFRRLSYLGSLDAWLGIELTGEGDLFTYDPAIGANAPLEVWVTDAYTPGVEIGLSDEIQTLRKALGNTYGQNISLDVHYRLPREASNWYQDKTGKINVIIHAVQAEHNTNAAGTGPISWR